jgi:hypothetical protein
MLSRPVFAVVLALSTFGIMGAKWTTPNFVINVNGGSEALAERLGQWAEYYRKVKAKEWLGREMPNWPRRCPLEVVINLGQSGGYTSFTFIGQQYLPIEMKVEGKMDRVIASVLPHEITHTVMAHYFGQPVPRWADEGAAVFSEDDQERMQHEGEVRRIMTSRSRFIPLRRLFELKEYPPEQIVLYAEGYSVTSMLVGRSNRQAFLAFVADGMRRDIGWDKALQTHYKIRNVAALEAEWLESLKQQARLPQTDATLASGGTATATGRSTEVVSRSEGSTRRTLPPMTPVLGTPRPVVRGARGSDTPRESGKNLDWATPTSAAPSSAPASPPQPIITSPVGVSLGTPRVKGVGYPH